MLWMYFANTPNAHRTGRQLHLWRSTFDAKTASLSIGEIFDMGMYTSVDAEIVVKPEALPIVARLTTERRHWVNEGESWETYESWEDIAIDYPWLKEWSENSRAGFIPFGGCGGHENKLEGNVWTFKCEVKNYDGTVEYFFEHVLPKLAESIPFLETRYEEYDTPSTWELIDGKVVCVKEESFIDGWGGR